MKKLYYREQASPVGELILGAIEGELCLCDWKDSERRKQNDTRIKRILHVDFVDVSSFQQESLSTTLENEAITVSLDILERAEQELEEYFAGNRKSFNIPLLLAGTDFQKSVWQALQEIPYGEVVTYMDIANRIGNPKGVRAVSQAIGSNPLSILVPCHRVVGRNGALTGYAGGLVVKQSLLELERGHKKGKKNNKCLVM